MTATPLDLIKLAPGLNRETVATLVIGATVLIAYGLGHSDLLKIALEAGPIDSIIKSIIGLLAAFIVGTVIRSAIAGPSFIAFYLLLLCYKRSRRKQQGQRGSLNARKAMMALRMVAIEFGLCRSGRAGRSPWLPAGWDFGYR